MAEEETGTSTTGTSTRGTEPRGTEPAITQSPLESLPYTKTPMTTAAPPLEQRPQKPPKYPWIIKKIDVFVLAGSLLDPKEELAAASRIWSQCNIEFKGIFHKLYNEEATRRLIGTNPGDDRKRVAEITVIVDPDVTTASVHNLRETWFKT